MGKIFKRTLATIMVVLMVLTSAPLSGFDFTAEAYSRYYYYNNNYDSYKSVFDEDTGTLTITGVGEMEDYTNVVEEEEYGSFFGHIIEDYHLYDDESIFFQGNDIEEIIIGEGITRIGNGTFVGCEDLKKVTLPSSIKSIGHSAFYGCTELEEINIPDSLENIECDAFKDTPFFDEQPDGLVYFGKTAYAYKGKMSENTVIKIKEGTKIIGNELFKNQSNIVGITIPDSVKSIGDSAFERCSELTNVTIPNSVESIGKSAFKECTKLANITISGKVTSIEESTFSDCIALAQIIIPNSVVSIGKSAFEGCENLVSITVPDSVTTIGISTFKECTKLTQANIPSSVKSISESAFSGCTNLTTVNISDGVKSIDDSAFYACKKLAKIILPDSITDIGASAFGECNDLNSISIPSDITRVGYNAFEKTSWWNSQTDSVVYFGKVAYKLKSLPTDGNVSIKKSTVSITDYAFENCKLKSVTIPDSVTHIGTGAFENCTSLKEITIPDSVTSIGDNVFKDCKSLAKISLPQKLNIKSNIFENTLLSQDGSIYVNGSIVKTYYPLPDKAHFKFKEGTVAIKDRAFESYDYCLCEEDEIINISTTVTIPDTVKYIGKQAFFCCRLKELNIPESVVTIGAGAFYHCDFKKVYIPETVINIGDFAFGFEADYAGDGYFAPARVSDFTIYAAKGTAAEKYAKENGFKFVEHTKHTIVTSKAKDATYTSEGLTEGKKCSGCGMETVPQTTIAKKTLGTTSKITTSVTSSSVKFTWNKVTGATGYRVFQKIDGKYKKVADTTKLTYTVKSLKANTKYDFAVRAYVLDGSTKVLAPKYKSVSATTSKAGLGTTSSITATKTSSSVKLTWNKVSGATGYRVYQKTASGWKTLANTTKLTYTIKSLKANTSYTFAIRAYVTKSGKTTLAPKYKSIAVTTEKASSKPGQVKNVKATPTATTVKLTWSKVSGVKGYYVFSYNAKTKKYTSLGKTTGTTYTVKKLKSNTAYSYAVQAYKVSGKKTIYGKVSSVVKVTTLLAAPTVKISSTKGKANLTWNNIAGESGYAIYMATSKNGKYTHLANYKANSTKATKSKLKSGKTYYFKVRAYKKANGKTTYGAYSAVKSVKIK